MDAGGVALSTPVSPGSDLPAILGGTPVSDRPLGVARPSLPGLDAIRESFGAVLASGTVTNHGPYVRALEERIAQYLGLPSVACTNNGQSAVMLALRAAGVERGEVIVPAYTFSATPHAVLWCGARPVFADIRSDTMCLDPEAAEACITDDTVAVMAVDVYGIAADRPALAALARRHGLRLVFDSAPAFGTRIGGRVTGGDGDAQAFSFHATKAFTTMEGGCVTSRDPDLVRRVAALRNFGQCDGADCDEPGINAKMLEVCAIVGLNRLPGLDGALRRRGEVAGRYRGGLAGVAGLSFAEPPADQAPTWLYFPVVIDAARFGLTRDDLRAVLEAENLFVRAYFGLPCHRMVCYGRHQQPSLPVTEAIAAGVLALPVYNDMTDAECDRFVDAVRRAHRHAAAIRARLGPGG
jgi:dTDP-4-amino-4,6-dideoxy-D-glucose transaminase